MARRKKRLVLDTYLNNRLTGKIIKQNSGAIEFSYDESWLNWEHSFPISMSLPLQEERYIGGTVAAVFENLLPDDSAIRRKLAETAHAEGTDIFSLLEATGRDCIGAMQFLREDEEPGELGSTDAKQFASDQEIAKTLKQLGDFPLGIGDDHDDFRISIAGVQAKTSLLRNRNKWYFPKSTTPTTHILKPSIGERGDGVDLSLSVENEYFCMKLLQALDLPAANTEIAEFDGTKTLIIERFDRRWTTDKRLIRVPQEDFCQALSFQPAQKYQSDGGPGIVDLMRFLRGSDVPEKDQGLFMKSQIVYWLLAATDGHAKNYSVFLLPGSRFSMTPLYDVMSIQPQLDARQIAKNKAKMSMSVGGKPRYVVHKIAPRHFLQTAGTAGMGESIVRRLFDELTETSSDAIEAVVSNLPKGFPEGLAASILEGFNSRLRLLHRLPASPD